MFLTPNRTPKPLSPYGLATKIAVSGTNVPRRVTFVPLITIMAVHTSQPPAVLLSTVV